MIRRVAATETPDLSIFCFGQRENPCSMALVRDMDDGCWLVTLGFTPGLTSKHIFSILDTNSQILACPSQHSKLLVANGCATALRRDTLVVYHFTHNFPPTRFAHLLGKNCSPPIARVIVSTPPELSVDREQLPLRQDMQAIPRTWTCALWA